MPNSRNGADPVHPAHGIGTHRLCRHGGYCSRSRKAGGEERTSDSGSFHPVCPAFVTNNHTAHITVQVLYNNFFSVFGFPQKLMSDQGTEFTEDVITAMYKLLGIEKIRTTPYHPQTNGSAERVHQTLQRMIGKLDPEKCRKWPEHIGSVLIAYNATQSQVTSYSPYFLMFGWRPRLPVDLLFPTVNT